MESERVKNGNGGGGGGAGKLASNLLKARADRGHNNNNNGLDGRIRTILHFANENERYTSEFRRSLTSPARMLVHARAITCGRGRRRHLHYTRVRIWVIILVIILFYVWVMFGSVQPTY